MPQINEERLYALAKQIKPVYTGRDENQYFMAPVSIKAAFNHNVKTVCKAENLKPVATLKTKHHSHHPTMREVYESIDELTSDVLENVVAFETKDIPRDFESKATAHIATTILYTGTLPEEIKNQDVIFPNMRKKNRPQLP